MVKEAELTYEGSGHFNVKLPAGDTVYKLASPMYVEIGMFFDLELWRDVEVPVPSWMVESKTASAWTDTVAEQKTWEESFLY